MKIFRVVADQDIPVEKVQNLLSKAIILYTK